MNAIFKIKYLWILLLGFTMVSCDEVPVVIPEGGGTGGGPTPVDSIERVVLLQELTGVKCPNCPTGAAEAKRLLNKYDDQLAVVAIHGDFLTTPLSESKYDFRTSFSRDIESVTSFIGKPAGAINRKVFDDPTLLAYDVDKWDAFIEAELQTFADIEIFLDAFVEDDQISVTVDLKPMKDLAGLNISVALTQGGIIDPQEEGSNVIEDYEHEHVLRHMFTQSLGDNLGNLTQDEITSRSYTFTMPADAEPAYDPSHIEIVAYITQDGASESPVIQTAKILL